MIACPLPGQAGLGGREMRKLLVVPLALAAVLLGLPLSPTAKADDWNKKTIVTFDQDVEIPGQVLPAGTYVFKLFGSSANRNIVQVWTGDESELITTLMTVGDSYPNRSGQPYFVLDLSGTDEGYPPIVVSWFFGNGDEGRDFIYSGYSNSRMLTDQEQVPPPPDNSAPLSDDPVPPPEPEQ
jgi:hypothetical protein